MLFYQEKQNETTTIVCQADQNSARIILLEELFAFPSRIQYKIRYELLLTSIHFTPDDKRFNPVFLPKEA